MLKFNGFCNRFTISVLENKRLGKFEVLIKDNVSFKEVEKKYANHPSSMRTSDPNFDAWRQERNKYKSELESCIWRRALLRHYYQHNLGESLFLFLHDDNSVSLLPENMIWSAPLARDWMGLTREFFSGIRGTDNDEWLITERRVIIRVRNGYAKVYHSRASEYGRAVVRNFVWAIGNIQPQSGDELRNNPNFVFIEQ